MPRSSEEALESLLPWLRDPACPLPGAAAQQLANGLGPGRWRLVTALQALGSGLRRSDSWRQRMQTRARRRLKRPEAKVQEVSEGWLKPLEKKGRSEMNGNRNTGRNHDKRISEVIIGRDIH